MIDLSKFEKIDGRIALKRLADGKEFYNSKGMKYTLHDNGELYEFTYFKGGYSYQRSYTPLTLFTENEWYIKKPFNVRETLIKDPNKWVAAYLGQECPHWFKVGFDLQSMSVCTLPLKENGDVGSKYVDYPDDVSLEGILDLCIDLSDVPLEATL